MPTQAHASFRLNKITFESTLSLDSAPGSANDYPALGIPHQISVGSLVNGKCIEFIERFSNQWPLKALYNIAQHSPIHAHIHTPTVESNMEGDGQLVGSSQGEASRSGTPRHSG